MKETESDGPSMTLRGKTILITRARQQAGDLTAELESYGGTVIHCPTIETIPPSDPAPLDSAIDRLEEYDWVIFTSANGVDFFFRRLRERRKDGVDVMGGKSICAIGTATAQALETNGAPPTITASESKGEGVVKELVDHLGGESCLGGLRVLIPRARVARDALPSGLRSLAAHVDAVEAYQTVAPTIEVDGIVRLFEEQSVDAITFTSSSTVSNFAAILGLRDLSGLLRNTLVACIGPITAGTAREYGLKTVIQPEAYNTHELVRSIVKAFVQAGRDPSL
ncbi:MAG TPA: uroporphyrinogen-III synthase [Blastocatellia bacterium]|nr:uroporphyrinogen-III synthase [Blastocatellia bacterium]